MIKDIYFDGGNLSRRSFFQKIIGLKILGKYTKDIKEKEMNK